jgi:hypothetical protein
MRNELRRNHSALAFARSSVINEINFILDHIVFTKECLKQFPFGSKEKTDLFRELDKLNYRREKLENAVRYIREEIRHNNQTFNLYVKAQEYL